MSAVTMILCIAKPIKLEMGFIYDLRYVPFILVALFGGYRNVLPLYLILNVYRLYVGGAGILPSFLFSTAVLLIVPFLSKWFIRQSANRRIVSATFIAALTMGIYLITLGMMKGTLDKQFWTLTFYALTTHVGVMSIIMILIEQIITNIETVTGFSSRSA